MVPFWGRCTTHFRTYFSGDWDVHWGYGLLTHGHIFGLAPADFALVVCMPWVLARSQGGESLKDITDEECQGGCVQARLLPMKLRFCKKKRSDECFFPQAVAWSPTRDEFILISGGRARKHGMLVHDATAVWFPFL